MRQQEEFFLTPTASRLAPSCKKMKIIKIRQALKGLKKINEEIQTWTGQHGKPPDDVELATAMNMEVVEVNNIMVESQPWISINDVILDSDGRQTTLAEVLEDNLASSPSFGAERHEMRTLLREAFRKLNPREQKVLYLYYYEDLTLSEVAAIFDLTEARICQIHSFAISKLKAMFDCLNDYEQKADVA